MTVALRCIRACDGSDEVKVRDSLLSAGHPIGRAKARFFQGPAGRAAALITVWIVRRGEDFPRFISAYPGDVE